MVSPAFAETNAKINMILAFQSFANLYIIALMINGINLFVIECLFNLVFKRKFNSTKFNFINLAPPETPGYRKYLINFLGYLAAPFTMIVTGAFAIGLFVFSIGYLIVKTVQVIIKKIKKK
jgi:hypothetical protein